MERPRLWTKDFLINSLTNFFIYLTYYLLMLAMTVFATNDFQATPAQAGLASGIFIVGALAGRLVAGKSIEVVGMKRMLYIGLVLFFATTLLYFVVNSLAFLFVVRFLHGAGFGVASTATGTIVSLIIPDERRGEGTGYYAMSTTLASAIGPFLGMYLSKDSQFTLIFILCTLVLMICFLFSFFLKVPKLEAMLMSKHPHPQQKSISGFRLTHFIEPKALPIAMISVFMGLSYSTVLSFLSSYTLEIDLVEAGSFFFIVYALFILISRPFTGLWFDKKGENFVMYPAILAFSIGLLILSQVQQGFVLLLAAALIGVGFGTFMSSAQAITVKVAPRQRIGLATSTFFVFVDAGIGFGPYLLGYFVPLLGYRGIYVIAGVLVFACSFLYFTLHGRKVAGKSGTSRFLVGS